MLAECKLGSSLCTKILSQSFISLRLENSQIFKSFIRKCMLTIKTVIPNTAMIGVTKSQTSTNRHTPPNVGTLRSGQQNWPHFGDEFPLKSNGFYMKYYVTQAVREWHFEQIIQRKYFFTYKRRFFFLIFFLKL